MEEKPGLASNLVLGLVVVAALLALGWFVYEPYATAKRLQDAVRTRDAEALSRDVDYDALGTNLKAEIRAALEAGAARQEQTPERALSAMFAAALIDPMVDMFVSPEGLSRLMQGAAPAAVEGEETQAAGEPDVEVSLGYDGLNRFAITVANPDAPDDAAIVFELSRYDLSTWKLTAIRLPEALLATPEAPAELTDAEDAGMPAETFNPYTSGNGAVETETDSQDTVAPDGACIDMHVAIYRQQNGDDADIPQAMLDAWYEDCAG